MRYLDQVDFYQHGIAVTPFQTATDGIWTSAREISSLQPLMELGSDSLAFQLRRLTKRSGAATRPILAATS
ncbi:hypothetical protein GCM10010193_29400 [Kitasatospora atroaurantiaca]|uniref:hypothetical protein n=1 Tax=Kitasatospora atroaurantiaca TaxID=285545 RepID=UPI0011A511DF|nr:hypothetical protein [Kitasatospora atroaurantiaca]